MKKILSILIVMFTLISFVNAWDSCEVGCKEETAACGAYIDTNSDGLCDHGQVNPNQLPTTSKEISLAVPVVEASHDLITGKELKEKTVNEVANIYEIPADLYAEELSTNLDIKVSPNHKFQTLHDNYNLEPSIAKEIALELRQKVVPEQQKVLKRIKYHPIEILIITSILYILTTILVRKNKLSLQNHRKIWNIILLVSFVVTAILGFLTTTQITNGWPSWNIRGWHVDPGIVFTVTGVFHTFWHIPYLKKMFKFN